MTSTKIAVYPGWDLLGFDRDPLPGAPDAIEREAGRLEEIADDAVLFRHDVEAVNNDPDLCGWVGDSGDVTRERLRCLPPRFVGMQEAHEACAGALRTWAAALRRGQEQVREALEQAREAQQEIDERDSDSEFRLMSADSGTIACGPGFTPSSGSNTLGAVERAEPVEPTVCPPAPDAEERLEAARARARAAVDETETAARTAAREIEWASTGEPEWQVWEPTTSDPRPTTSAQPAGT